MSTTTRAPSRACYLRGCGHSACRQRHLRYCKQYQFDTAHHGPRTTPAAPYIPKVQALVTDGWTHSAIAQATGVGKTTIRDLAAGEDRSLYLNIARLLDQNLPTGTPQNWWVDATGTMRRIQALTVMGWPQERTAAALGIGYSTVRSIANGRRRHTPRHTANAVAELYADWSRRPGPSLSAAGRARARGWPSPVAWDNNIDDPAAEPEIEDLTALNAPSRDHLSRTELAAERREWIKRLMNSGHESAEIATRLGMNVTSVRAIVHELRTGKRRDRRKPVAA